jgi:hypothetical protein
MREASACLPTSSKDLREQIESGHQSAIWLSETPVMDVLNNFFRWTANPCLHLANGNLLTGWHPAEQANALGIRDDKDRDDGMRVSDKMLNKRKTAWILITNAKGPLIFWRFVLLVGSNCCRKGANHGMDQVRSEKVRNHIGVVTL